MANDRRSNTPKARSRRALTKRPGPNEKLWGELAQPILDLLNKVKTDKVDGGRGARERVEAIYRAIMRLRGLKGSKSVDFIHESVTLTQVLSRYETSPAVLPSPPLQWSVQRKGDLKSPYWGGLEAIVVGLVVDLDKAGRLVRVRQCTCGRWFYSRRLGRQHCSDICRKKAYKPSKKQAERQRERRREYMRGYMTTYRKKNYSKE